MIPTYYIQAKIKKSVQYAIKQKQAILCLHFGWMENTSSTTFDKIPEGSVIKIFSEYVGGSPYAKSYGNKKNGKLI